MIKRDEFIGFLKERNIKAILHFPHVGLNLPKQFFKGLLIGPFLLFKYVIEMSDYEVDKLFKSSKR